MSSMPRIYSPNGNDIDCSQAARSSASFSEWDHLPEDPQSTSKRASAHPWAAFSDHGQPSS